MFPNSRPVSRDPSTLRSQCFCLLLPHRNTSGHISVRVCNAILQRLWHCPHGRLQYEKPEYVQHSREELLF